MKLPSLLADLAPSFLSPYLPYLGILLLLVLTMAFFRPILQLLGVVIIPDILIAGGGGDNTNGPLAGLLGMKLMQELGGGGTSGKTVAPVPPAAKPVGE